MYLIIGLGNPEEEYARTRHNMGFDTINKISEKYNIKVNKSKFNALYGTGDIEGEKAILLKPQTYMNLSGESIVSVCQFFKPEYDHLIVMYDDIDLDVGKLRIRKKGSAGSHNGMKSIIKSISTQEFPRIRIGVSKPAEGWDLADFVLSKLSKEDSKAFDESLDRAVLTVEEIISSGIEPAMNKYNG